MVERSAVNRMVVGSSPTTSAFTLWCNGSTSVFGSVSHGSSPCGVAFLGSCCNGSDSRLHRDRIGSIPILPTIRGRSLTVKRYACTV
jgi:hypothetical protein